MRTMMSIKNLLYSLIGQFFGVAISFFARILFIQILNAEYLGINGLFTNLLTLLSLAELGVGSAISFSLYKPIAENNVSKIKALMNFYKKAYSCIGIVILLLGIAFFPIYRIFISEVPQIPYLDLIFILFVANTAISYFYSYKRSFIICNQKRYIVTAYRYVCYFLLNVVQIIVLICTENYILFLIIQILFTGIENILVSRHANKLYPFLKEKNSENLDESEYKVIKKNVFAMMFHKIGGLVVNSTDNLLISRYVGLVEVGLYSNYFMVINALEMIILQIFNAILASVGNLHASEDKEKSYKVFKHVFFLNFVVFGITSVSLVSLLNPFITIWIGDSFTFDETTVLIIIACFYLKGIRRSCLTFREAFGLFWYDRYKPLVESFINLVASIVLAKKFGVSGIFLGTILSTVVTSLWIEPYVLYKYGFERSVKDYAFRLVIYSVSLIIIGSISVYACSYISRVSWISFIMRGVLSVGITSSVLCICYWRTEEFQYYILLIKKLISNPLHKAV